MTATILAVLAPLWRPILAALAGLGAYLKGRSDASRKAELESRRAADHAERQRAETERVVRSRDAADELRRDWSR